jgi:hypothetical protein
MQEMNSIASFIYLVNGLVVIVVWNIKLQFSSESASFYSNVSLFCNLTSKKL